MNQILYTGKNKQRNNGPASLKSIIKFFAIALILLGIIFIVEGSYSTYSSYLANKEVEALPAEIKFEQEGNVGIITASHDSGISKVKYHWNESNDTIIQGSGEAIVIIDNISILAGINTLYVTVIDVNGNETNSSYEYSYDGIYIDLAVVNNSDIQITASDVSGLSYITYKWNSDEETYVYPELTGAAEIEQTTQIPSGLNTLTVTAVNSSNYTLTKTLDVKGVHVPEFTVYIDSGVLYVTVLDEEGINEITQVINDGDAVVYNANGDTVYSYTTEIGDQDILVTITATNVEDAEATYKGKNY